MNYSRQIAWAVILGILSAAAPSISAQSGVHTDGGDHKMVTPDDLMWVDVRSLPPGAKLAVIEGPLNEAVPFNISSAISRELPNSRTLASGGRAGHGDFGGREHGNRRQAG
jgi:hypothetical protein